MGARLRSPPTGDGHLPESGTGAHAHSLLRIGSLRPIGPGPVSCQTGDRWIVDTSNGRHAASLNSSVLGLAAFSSCSGSRVLLARGPKGDALPVELLPPLSHAAL